MKNSFFTVEFDREAGTIAGLFLNADIYHMNFIKEGYGLNRMKWTRRIHNFQTKDMSLVSFRESEESGTAVFRLGVLEVETQYTFSDSGNLCVTNRLCNLADRDIFMERGEWGIAMPFADEYPGANICMTNRCHAHVWCGLEGASYICCLKMGEEKDNLGILATRGGWDCYSQEEIATNNRGCLVVHPDVKILPPKETYVMEYEVFPCAGREEFLRKCCGYGHFINIEASNYSLFAGEKLQFVIREEGKDIPEIQVEVNGTVEELPLTFTQNGEGIAVSCLPEKTAEYRFLIRQGKVRTCAVFQVNPRLEDFIKRRVEFIVKNQQYHKKGSALDGAYLIYDNAENQCYYEFEWPDWNASRERIGMGILIAKYLQTYFDEEIYQSLMQYEVFVRREIYCETTGQIYDGVGDKERVRLYNFLWYAIFYMELFYLTKEEKYLADMTRIVNCYYEMGGKHHYPNAVFVSDFLNVLRKTGKDAEYELLCGHFQEHVENVAKTGFSYPEHEVKYEQTIVSPAVALLLDACEHKEIPGMDAYDQEMLDGHVQRLLRFDGFAPHYKLYSVAIRYWDAYWFGKRRQFGDTFPHYWSCLSSVNYLKYGKLTGNERYSELGENGLRNCLCCFFEDGRASCASVFPFRVNGRPGEYYDEYANDQDFALYFAWRFLKP